MQINEFDDPIVFEPIFKKKVWGGRNLKDLYNKNLPDDDKLYGESWEICDRPGSVSVVKLGILKGKNLNELWIDSSIREPLFGLSNNNSIENQSKFPILLKILDCNKNLSIQVHPSKKTAQKFNGERKNEFWYIAKADKKSLIYAGIVPGVTKDDFLKSIDEETVSNQVHNIKSKSQSYIYLPSGRIHSLGSGNIVFEVQENSDTTYRIYDWGRNESDGENDTKRELHIDKAIESIDFGDINPEMLAEKPGILNENENFTVSLVKLNNAEKLFVSTFAIFCVISGKVKSGNEVFMEGDFFMIPNKSISKVKTLKSEDKNTKLLKVIFS